MNDGIIFLKGSLLSDFLILQSNVSHSIIAEWKKVFLKKSRFAFIDGILLQCFDLYNIFCVGTIE